MIVDFLGMGGMGVVYKAFDPVLNRAIALKVLLFGEERSGIEDSFERRRTRALREAQALAQLTHPNVVAIYDVGTHDNRVFMAMELVEGVTLASYLKEPTHTRAEVLEVLVAAGRGLAAAHKLGIIHRDFKPTNVLIGKDGRVRVIDFGLARAGDHGDRDEDGPWVPPSTGAEADADEPPTAPLPRKRPALAANLDGLSPNLLSSEMTQQGLVLGTPMYMAPEQQDGKHLDATADQFSFAVVLFEALYGQRPFAGDSVEEVARNARAHKLERPAQAQVPVWLDRIVDRGLSPDPRARFPSMEGLLAALTDDPEERRRRTREQRTRQLGIAFALALVGGSLFVAWRTHRAAQQVCRGAESKLVGVWDASVKESSRKAFLATDKAFAQRAFDSGAETLDRYAAAWATMHTEACEASSVRHEQSSEILTLRMNCLAHRLGELKTAAKLFSTADAEVVQKASAIADRLSSIAGCGDLEALTAPIAPPKDPATRALVEQLREELSQAKVLGDAARFASALSIAEAAVTRAATTHYRPIEAEAELRRGILLDDLGRYEESLTALRRAFLLALGSRHNEVVVDAAAELISVMSVGLSRPSEALQWSQITEAALASAPENPQAQARWLNSTGVVYLNLGERDKAEDHFKRALALREKATGPGAGRALAGTLLDLGVLADERGQYEQARAYYQRALQLWERELGPDHPNVSSIANNLGVLAWEHGDYAEAEQHYKRALKISIDAFGNEHPDVAMALLNLGLNYFDAGREAEALDHFQRSMAMGEKVYGKTHVLLVWALSGLGRIKARHRQLDEARADFERALAICGTDKCRAEERLALAEAKLGLAQLVFDKKPSDARARTLAHEARELFRGVKSAGAKRRLQETEAWMRDKKLDDKLNN